MNNYDTLHSNPILGDRIRTDPIRKAEEDLCNKIKICCCIGILVFLVVYMIVLIITYILFMNREEVIILDNAGSDYI